MTSFQACSAGLSAAQNQGVLSLPADQIEQQIIRAGIPAPCCAALQNLAQIGCDQDPTYKQLIRIMGSDATKFFDAVEMAVPKVCTTGTASVPSA